jgi:hypothetical protein
MSLIDDLAANNGKRMMTPPTDERLEKGCPLLWSMLVQAEFADGTQRVMPDIIIRRVTGGYEVTLRDHDFCLQKTAMTRTMDGAFKALEKSLADPEAPWKPYASQVPSEYRKKHEKKKT